MVRGQSWEEDGSFISLECLNLASTSPSVPQFQAIWLYQGDLEGAQHQREMGSEVTKTVWIKDRERPQEFVVVQEKEGVRLTCIEIHLLTSNCPSQ